MDATQLINAALDRARNEQKLTSDAALANLFGVSDMAIYRWRRGEVSKAARILIPLICEHCTHEQPPTQK